jgi:hypothetical protein
MTEQRLIDIKPLMANSWHLVQTGESNWFIRSMSLADVPVVEARPVIHAKWELVQNGKGCCSNCNRLDSIDSLATYCRYCGAIMDGE